MKSVVLLSGGLDSTVAFALKAADAVLAVTYDYGQRAAKREIEAARAIATHYAVRHEIRPLPLLSQITSTSLVNRAQPLPSPDLDDRKAVAASAKAVWVPNRNGVMIHLAAAEAEAIDAGELIVGFNKEEAATFPDNSAAYLKAVTKALRYSTSNRVRVVSPTVGWDKKLIVKEGQKIGAPLHLIWPCYEGGAAWCRRCESCRRCLRALA